MKQLFFLFVLFVGIGNAQEKRHRPKAQKTIGLAKFQEPIVLKPLDTLPPKPTDSLPQPMADSLRVLTKADSLKLLVKQLAGKEAVVIDTVRITIKDYQIISHTRDTMALDTTLSIAKEYRYNYLRQDNFELMPMANMGQPYTALGAQVGAASYMPAIGGKAWQYAYKELEAVRYYNVPTPMTEMMFKTSMQEGQFLDFLITANTSRKSNFSIAHTGFRSLGKYDYDQVMASKFIATYNYQTKNDAYSIRAHYAAQTIEGQEHGGLQFKERQFESADPSFLDRSRIDLYFTNALSVTSGKRVFLDQTFRLTRAKSKDSLAKPRKSSLVLGHTFSYETRSFQFLQTSRNDYFGEAFSSSIRDKAHLKSLNQEVSATFSNPLLGRLKTHARFYDYQYYFNSLLITETQTIASALSGTELALGGTYQQRVGPFVLNAAIDYTLVGDLTSHKASAALSYVLHNKHEITLGVRSQLRMPDFNFLLYQSEYKNYNWQHTLDFQMQDTKQAFLKVRSPIWGTLNASYTRIGSYTYFAAMQPEIPLAELPEDYVYEQVLDNAHVKPLQEAATVSVLKVKYQNEIRKGHFALNNTLMYQNVAQQNGALFLPELTTRSTLYFSKNIFNNAMFLQTGLTFKYFTSFFMNGYSPVMGEFYTQSSTRLGGYPLLDFFINGKVKQTRIYFKAEHFNAPITGYDYYVAPGYPYRDFVIRFGLVWNFFK